MSFAFCFDRDEDVYQFAYCYPYSYTRLQNYLDMVEKKGYDYLQRELLCLSVVSVMLPWQPRILAIFTIWHVINQSVMKDECCVEVYVM